MVQHSIDTQNSKPIKQGPRRLPFHRRQEVKQLLDSMLENDIIEPANGPWASPIVLKKMGPLDFVLTFVSLIQSPGRMLTPSQELMNPWMHCMEHAGSQHWTLQAVIGRWELLQKTERKRHSLHHLGCANFV